jgi:transitional endoplasmic reticulum ATPase
MSTSTTKEPSSIQKLEDFLGKVDKKAADKAWTSIDTDVMHQGKQIILPNEPVAMSYDAGIATLQRKKDEEAQMFSVNESIDGIPWDAAVATYRAITQLYGFATSSSIRTFFGKINPSYFTVHTGLNPTDVVQVPIGQLTLPGEEDSATFIMKVVRSGVIIQGDVNKKSRSRLVEIAALARDIMRTESIYRGKAIRLRVTDNGELDIAFPPEFIDLEGVSEDDIVFDELTRKMIEVNIFSPMKNTTKCRKNRIPLKRGILLEGPYGTGKSLTAKVSAKVACDNGWTFILLGRSQGFKSALTFGKTMQPVVVFAEDADRAADREHESVNDLINTLDGVDTKNNEVMLITTTNYVERIDRALLRPGRFDAIISLRPPEGKVVEDIMRRYAGELLSPTEDLAKAASFLSGQVPASIREVVDRAKLAMFMRDAEHVTADDLEVQAFGMKRHLDLLNKPEATETPQEKLWATMSLMVDNALDQTIKTAVKDIKQHVTETAE